MFNGKKILITGGTGSLGIALTKKMLESQVDTIRIYSRDESKQTDMKSIFEDSRLRFLIGDVREKDRLSKALEDIDIVIHAAALKQVPVAEYNAFEAVKTNVNGAQNVIECCLENNVEIALAIGTDKAVSPFNTYGATKLLMERLFISANYYKGKHPTKFLCVRYGNVMGSRGSVIPFFTNLVKNGKYIPVTDTSMTRFNITMSEALDLVFRAISSGKGGQVFVPKLKAYKLGILVEALLELTNVNAKIKKIPVRPGEKFHELLINKDEIRNTFETEKDYLIMDEFIQEQLNANEKFIKSELTNQYSSDLAELLSKEEIKNILKKEKLEF